MTLLHLAEYLVEILGKRRVLRHHKVLEPDGSTATRTVECLDDTDGIVAWRGEDYFAVILRHYLAGGRATVGQVGNARSELVAAPDLLGFAVDWMQKRLAQPVPGNSAEP